MDSPANPRLPDAIRRLRHWYWLAALCPLLGVVKTVLKDSLPVWTERGDVVFLIPTAMILTFVLVRAAEERLVRRVRAADYRICPTCLYPLAGESGLCPECGEAFTVGSARERWAVAES